VLLGLRKKDGDWRERKDGSPTGEVVVEEREAGEDGGIDTPPLLLLLLLPLLGALDEPKPSTFWPLLLPPLSAPLSLNTFISRPKAFKWAKTAVAALSPLSNAPFNVAVFR
jgi:hypothetical protein